MTVFPQLLKSFPKLIAKEIPEALGKQADEMIGASKQFLKTETDTFDLNFKSKDTYRYLKGLIDRGNDFNRKIELQNSLETHGKADKLNSYRTKFFEEKIDLAYQGAFFVKENLIKNFEHAFDSVSDKLLAKQYKEYFSLSIFNPAKLYSKTGISQKDIFLSLKGHVNTVPAKQKYLENLTSAYKQIDDRFINIFKDIANVGNLKNYVAPVWAFSENLVKIQKEELAELFVKHTNIKDRSKALIMAEKLQKRALNTGKGEHNLIPEIKTGKQTKTKGLLSIESDVRSLQFDSDEAEYFFLKGINMDWTNNNSLMQSVITNKEKGVIRGMFYKEFGANPYENIKDVIYEVSKKHNLKGDVNVKRIRQKLEFAFNINIANEGSLKNVTDTFDKMLSATYGAVTSLPRQAFIDATNHASAIRKASFDNRPVHKFWFDRFYTPLSATAKNAFKTATGGDNTAQKQMDNLLNIMGFSSYNSATFKSFGFGYQNQVQLETIAGKEGLEYITSYMSYLAGKFNENMHKIAGNVVHYDAGNAVNILNNSVGFTNTLLKNTDYADISRAFGKKIRYMEDFFGMGEREFTALKQVKRTKISGKDYSHFIGANKNMEFITFDNILNLGDDVANHFKKSGETAEAFKQRLALNFYQMMSDQAQKAQSHVTKTRIYTDRWVKRGTFLDLILRPTAFKFMNITEIQLANLKRGIGIQMYGSPFEGSFTGSAFKPKLFKEWVNAFAWYSTGAISLMHTKDVLHGRKPRKLNAENLMYAEIQSGLFGVSGMLFEMSKNLAQKGRLNTVGDSYVKLSKNLFDEKTNSVDYMKWLKRSSGVGSLWYTSPVMDYLIHKEQDFVKDRVKYYQSKVLGL